MHKWLKSLLVAGFFLTSPISTAWAETVLLVPGYLTHPHKWRASGIGPVLARHGIADAGHMEWRGAGVVASGVPSKSQHRFFTLRLPTEAPIDFQARILSAYIQKAQALFPDDNIALVGYSAGGIVARHTMVRLPNAKVNALITIASPNLGTQTALLGRAIGNSPMGWFAPFFGGNTVNRSQWLYRDLSPENPGNLVGHLNRVPHPKARYMSIIHSLNAVNPNASDTVIKGWRQDLNNVVALRGLATTQIVNADHNLVPMDGFLIARFLLSKNVSK